MISAFCNIFDCEGCFHPECECECHEGNQDEEDWMDE